MNKNNAVWDHDSSGSKESRASETKLDDWLKDAIEVHEHGLVRYAQQFVCDLERARDVVQALS